MNVEQVFCLHCMKVQPCEVIKSMDRIVWKCVVCKTQADEEYLDIDDDILECHNKHKEMK